MQKSVGARQCSSMLLMLLLVGADVADVNDVKEDVISSHMMLMLLMGATNDEIADNRADAHYIDIFV